MSIETKMDELRKQLSDMVSVAREEGRALTEEERSDADMKLKELEELKSTKAIADALTADERDALLAEKELARARRQFPGGKGADKGGDEKEDKGDGISTDDRRSFRDYICRGQSEGTANKGGYLVPAELYDEIVKVRDAGCYIRGLATVVGQATGTLNVAAEGAAPSFGWVAEGGSISAVDQTFAQPQLILRKLAGVIKVTQELLADAAFDVENYLIDKAGREFAKAEEAAFVNGTAANNKPVGILQQGITPSRTTTTTGCTLADLTSFFYTLAPEYAANAAWLISPGLASVIAQMDTGTGGPLVWGGNIAGGAPLTLFGRPCYISSNLNALSANKEIAVLGDWSYYMIGDQGTVNVERLNELYADTDEVGFKFTERVSGNCVNTDAFKVLATKAS